MRNPNNIHQLIDGFRKQNRKTIWSHLDTLCTDPEVFSEQLSAIGPHLYGHRLFLYTDRCSLVLVCLDNCAHIDELADEDELEGEEPLYFTKDSHRVSPVWKLSKTLRIIRDKLYEKGLCLHLRGVLLSESHILNADETRPRWDEMDVIVIDRLKGMAGRHIGVSADPDMEWGQTVMEALEDIVKKPDEDNSEVEKEFERMLNEFISSPSEKEEADDDEEASGLDDDDELLPECDDPSFDFPDGIIEQNHNLSVKAKILPPLEHPRKELERLVGCQDIKARLDELLALTRYNKMLRKAFPDAKEHEVSLHSIFFGRPGTGKTTVCKIFGSLLHEAGALSKGHVVVADRGTFIGSLWGDEERSVRQVVEMAQGGVLMIDEAYLLNGKHDHDPGKIVIQLLMEVLADESRRDLAVVLCGYKDPMMRLLDSNPGLPSRFPNRFEFQDFSVDDLLEISRRRVDEYQYHFTRQAWQKYSEVLKDAYRARDPQSWGNARFVANQLERIYIQHAQRCTKGRAVTGKRLLTITPADVVPIEVPRPPRHLGF